MKEYSVAYQPKTYQEFIKQAYAKYLEHFKMPTYLQGAKSSQVAQASATEVLPDTSVQAVEITTELVPAPTKRFVTPKAEEPKSITVHWQLVVKGSLQATIDSTTTPPIIWNKSIEEMLIGPIDYRRNHFIEIAGLHVRQSDLLNALLAEFQLLLPLSGSFDTVHTNPFHSRGAPGSSFALDVDLIHASVSC